ncbi:MAG: right-handed parallel beta-helix repeat-containing protein [Phycisphaerae bacterium]|nr:right-handed parallel beta-helix repeat-containing protein [Tepidisphaeraceae bacterium]
MPPRLLTPLLALLLASAALADPPKPPGLTGPVGPRGAEPKRVGTFLIDKPGVYEDYLVDVQFAEFDAVRIKADNVTLRRCEIRNGRRDAVEVYAKDVLIEDCKIHHFLGGSFKDQKDAHGITGQPTRLTIRNCEIGLVSGDCLQFDPGRKPWTDVVVENCRLYAAPLPADAADFKKGESPGENAVDTKQSAANPRSKITLRDCVFEGFSKNGFIGNRAALNLKNHVEVIVERCVFDDNEIAVRARGPGKKKNPLGGALVDLVDCAFYRSPVAIRAEDDIARLHLTRPRFDASVEKKLHTVGGKPAGLKIEDERPADPREKR